MSKRIYLDYASSSFTNSDVLNTYKDCLDKYYVNNEALYDEAIELNELLNTSRQQVASLLGVRSNEVIYTSSGSEANTLAIKGVALKHLNSKKHLITTNVEHSSVLNCFRSLESDFGFNVTWLKVNNEGVIDVNELKQAITPETILVSVIAVNNEIGAINPIDEISKIVKKSNALLHVDFVQALGKMDIDLTNIDLASFSAHKIGGLKGSGLLIRKQHIDLLPLINGGQQEFGIRGGTTNALVNIMFAKTLRIALEEKDEYISHCTELKSLLLDELSKIDSIRINSPKSGICSLVSFSCVKMTSEVMMNALNNAGFCVSAQSTCHSKSKEVSHVLRAIGLSDALALSNIRVSFSLATSKDDILSFINSLKEIIKHYGT